MEGEVTKVGATSKGNHSLVRSRCKVVLTDTPLRLLAGRD